MPSVLATLRDLVAPPACASCERRMARAACFCAVCAETVERCGERGSLGIGAEGSVGIGAEGSVVAFAIYGGALAHALNRMKHHDRPDLARPLGALLCQAIAEHALACDAVVPVPLHPLRLATRGFNQAGLLAAQAGRALGVPARHRLLERAQATPPQQGLSAAERRRNVAGAFRLRAAPPARVLLVDDVCTTGATLAACAAPLIAAGCRVSAVVVARA